MCSASAPARAAGRYRSGRRRVSPRLVGCLVRRCGPLLLSALVHGRVGSIRNQSGRPSDEAGHDVATVQPPGRHFSWSSRPSYPASTMDARVGATPPSTTTPSTGSPPATSPNCSTTAQRCAAGPAATTPRASRVPGPQGRTVHPPRRPGRPHPRRRLLRTGPADGPRRQRRRPARRAGATTPADGARSEKNHRPLTRSRWGQITGEHRGQFWLTQPAPVMCRKQIQPACS